MPKTSTMFICQNCSATKAKWSGKCDDCGEWNTFVEQLTKKNSLSPVASLKPTNISTLKLNKNQVRLTTGITDIDHVLGGGIVQGSVNLIAGEPGMGKSTLLLQIANSVAANKRVVYISAEESASQIKLRADRLGVKSKTLELAISTDADEIAATIANDQYDLAIVDSIQTVSTSRATSAAGTVSQITNSAQALSSAAKTSRCSLVIVGHVTKQGSIAGPKLLEHLVDTVLYLEGDQYEGLKTLKSIKNRYGSTNELALLQMQDSGLIPIDNPSKTLLKERQITDGSIVLATIQGSRALLVEVQALVNTTAFGYPKRTASGFDINRLNLLVAMLSRRTKLKLSDKDVFINIVGGMKISDPGADLAVCMAIASAAKSMTIKSDAVVFGEVGLSGEIRHVFQSEKRQKEAKKLGFKNTIGPRFSKSGTSHQTVKTIKDALNKNLVSS